MPVTTRRPAAKVRTSQTKLLKRAPEDDFALRTLVAFRLWQARLAHGFSQSTLAKFVGLDQKTVSSIERGAVDPKLSALRRLSGALGLPMAELFLTPSQSEPGTSSELAEQRAEEERTVYDAARAAFERAWRAPKPEAPPPPWVVMEAALKTLRPYGARLRSRENRARLESGAAGHTLHAQERSRATRRPTKRVPNPDPHRTASAHLGMESVRPGS